MNHYFTADWHLGDNREVNGVNLLMRTVNSITQSGLIQLSVPKLEYKSTLWHLGDVLFDTNYESELKKITKLLRSRNITFNLIKGNYDEDKIGILSKYFDHIYDDYTLFSGDNVFYLNHYPSKCNEQPLFSLTGHIHSLWKVQRNMINVGIDCWYYNFASMKEILFLKNGIENHYDNNVFLKQ